MDQIPNALSQKSENPSLGERAKVGFKINQFETALYHAVRTAYDFVIMARDKGAQIRTWVLKATEQTDNLVNWAEDFQMNRLGPSMTREETQKKISELGLQESRILRVVHQYLNEINQLKNNLRLLDPPLTSNQLQPFLDAVSEDRKRTIAALEILTAHIEKLTKIKINICRDFQKFFAE